MQLMEKARTRYSECRIPGMVMTACGTLLAYYECRDAHSDWARIDLKVIRSTDGGESWQTVMIIPGGENTLNNPVMIVDGEVIHFLYCKNYFELYICQSTDDGLTFTQAQNRTDVFSGFFYNAAAIGPGHGIAHRGALLVPAWFADHPTDPQSHRPSVIRILYSLDHGENWRLSDIIGRDVLVNPSECALAVMKDGSVLISIRNENECRRRAYAVSKTGIEGWTALRFAQNMPDPICMGSMAHHNGTVYHINCASETKRGNLTLKISADGFETFEERLVDAVGGYADVAVDGRTAYVLYERDVSNDGMYFTTVSL